MPLIRECVVTTLTAAGEPHLAPLGLIKDGDHWIIAPFRPSMTLSNLEARGQATASFIDDAEVFAGFVTGQRDWPLAAIDGGRRRVLIAPSRTPSLRSRASPPTNSARGPFARCDALNRIAPFSG